MDAAAGATSVKYNRVLVLGGGGGGGEGRGSSGSEESRRNLAVSDGVVREVRGGRSRRRNVDDEGDEEERDGDEEENASVPLDLLAERVIATADGALQHLVCSEEALEVVITVLIRRRRIRLVLKELGGRRRSVPDLTVASGSRGRSLLL